MRCLSLLLLLVLVGCDGPVGLVDTEGDVRAEAVREGITVENRKDEPIYVVAYGEAHLQREGAIAQTLARPGQGIGVGETFTFPFASDGPIRSADAVYRVAFVTIKGEGRNRAIAERGELELAR